MEELDELIEEIEHDLVGRIDDCCELLKIALFIEKTRTVLNCYGDFICKEIFYEHPNGYQINRRDIIGSQNRISICTLHEYNTLLYKKDLIIDNFIELSNTLLLIEEATNMIFSDSRCAIIQKLREEKINLLGI